MSIPTVAPFLSRCVSPLVSTLNSVIVGATQFDLPSEPNPKENPKNSRAYTDGDPFLVKLYEIDYDLRRFDKVLGDTYGTDQPKENLLEKGKGP